ncbi:MAG: hypothetical protein MUC87_20110 [Bacteroidia bacterium]|nr:hypothetical protein [Bacteroidia bacterium]
MYKHTHLLLLLFIALISGSCFLRKKEKQQPIDYAAQGYVKALVVDYELDGCKWMLRLDNDDPNDDDKKMEPDFLFSEFQKDSLPVWLKYQREERISICMAGETVKVIDIKKR